MGCCRPPSPCPGHPDREACARKWPCALRRAVCELWQGRRGGIGRTRSRDGMAAPLSSKERVSQLVHGESRGEKGGVAGDPRSHSDNSKNPQNVVLASWFRYTARFSRGHTAHGSGPCNVCDNPRNLRPQARRPLHSRCSSSGTALSEYPICPRVQTSSYQLGLRRAKPEMLRPVMLVPSVGMQ